MSKRSAVSIGIVMLCMAAILLFGQKRLQPDGNDVDNIQVQGMNRNETQEIVDNTLEDEKIYLIDQDVFHELPNGKEALEESPGAKTVKDGLVQGTALNSEEEDTEQEMSKQEIQQLRQEEVIEALNIKNPEFQVSAKAAVLLNSSTGEILYSKNALEEIQPASTAKLLTAIVAAEVSDEHETFTVGNEITLIASDSSRAYLVKGQVLSLSQILDALLLPSGNDAAYVIAANLGRKIAGDDSMKAKAAVQVFLQKMNKKAEEIGVVHSNFASPDGYDADGQYTTAYDMALIGAEALKYREIQDTVVKTKARDILLSGEDVTWYNSNKLMKEGSGYYYKYAIGLKTGSSGEAGRCLVSAAQKGESVFVSAVMDASYEGRWQDSIDLLSYGIEQE